ncbi:MAG: GNAT family N-acetyltransferase [Ilumatobacteraceae bacterium]|jgi:RimJ/RimL family protein N-acetyltransferase
MLERNIPLESSRVRIRHVEPSDYKRLYEIEHDQETLHTWKYRGNFPTHEEYEATLWKQTYAILVVESTSTDEIVGYHHLHDVDHRAGHGWFSVYSAPDKRSTGLAMEGYVLFVDWVFANTPLRWIYAYVFSHNWPSFDSSVRKGHILHVGTMKERLAVDGELTDVHVLAASQQMFEKWPLRIQMHRGHARRSRNSD